MDASYSRAAGWVDQRTVGRFVCRSDFALVQIASLLVDLEELQKDMVRQLKLPSAEEATELYLFGNQRAYVQFLARYYPQVPYRRALYVKSGGVGRVMAFRGQNFEMDVRHECTHALLHAVLPMVPLWLDEGLAVYFEIASEDRLTDNVHTFGLRKSLWSGSLLSIESLESKRTLGGMGTAEYQSAWAWVHFMLQGPAEGHDELIRFLADIRASAPPGLLSQRLRSRMPDLTDRAAEHWRRWAR